MTENNAFLKFSKDGSILSVMIMYSKLFLFNTVGNNTHGSAFSYRLSQYSNKDISEDIVRKIKENVKTFAHTAVHNKTFSKHALFSVACAYLSEFEVDHVLQDWYGRIFPLLNDDRIVDEVYNEAASNFKDYYTGSKIQGLALVGFSLYLLSFLLILENESMDFEPINGSIVTYTENNYLWEKLEFDILKKLEYNEAASNFKDY